MPRAIAFFKPFGVLSSFTHEEQSTRAAGAADASSAKRTLSEFGLPKGVYAAGRLDYDSEGLLILSDDGALIHRLTDPRYKLPKTYYVQVEGVPTEDALQRLRRGVTIKGYRTLPCRARVLSAEPDLPPRSKPITPHGPTAWLEIVLREGKKRQVRHMTAAVGLPTLRLVRVAIGPITLAGLAPGQWRDLSESELDSIIRYHSTMHSNLPSPATARRRKPNVKKSIRS
ncbi:MAG: ribosomal large subunit pseudouridine synthase E [Candidatus Roseilinea sp.]|nr:MAG: ribosomal large subunit pseudouridine synthase E [Candidatus Roseilinea sp.]